MNEDRLGAIASALVAGDVDVPLSQVKHLARIILLALEADEQWRRRRRYERLRGEFGDEEQE